LKAADGSQLAGGSLAWPLWLVTGNKVKKLGSKVAHNDQERKNSSCHSCANQRGVGRKFRSLVSHIAKQKNIYIYIHTYILITQPIPVLRKKPPCYQS